MLTNGWGFAAPAARPTTSASRRTPSSAAARSRPASCGCEGTSSPRETSARYDGGQGPIGVLLEGSAITASSNRVRGANAMLILRVNEGRFAAVGNLASGGTRLNSPTGALPPVWQPLNPTVP